MNLAHLLATQAALHPEQPALVDVRTGQPRRVTFAELEQASARAAGLLRSSGLQPGDAVLVFQPMSIELYIALAALFRSGLVAMFLDPKSGREHIEQCCALWAPRALIACPKAHLLHFISAALRRIPIQFSVGMPLPWANPWARWKEARPRAEIEPCQPDRPALVTFTSGSTGQPKGAMRTHGFLLNQQRVLERSLQLKAGEVDLTTLPTFALANLASGVTTVISGADVHAGSGAGAAGVVRQIQEQHVDRIGAAPSFLERLTGYCLARSEVLAGVRKIYTGGGPVFPKLLEQVGSVAPQASVTALYGCTEAEPIALLERRDICFQDRQGMSSGAGLLAGQVEPTVAVRILPDADGQPLGPFTDSGFESQSLPAGQAGEIVVSGPHVLGGYLNASEDSKTKIRVANRVWHRTGDAGYIDARARLWLLGRCCARVDDEHERIYPLEVESVVRQLTEGCQAALVSDRGRRTLLVGRRGSVEVKKLAEVLRRWHIDRVKVVRSLPWDRRHRSKIDYNALPSLAS